MLDKCVVNSAKGGSDMIGNPAATAQIANAMGVAYDKAYEEFMREGPEFARGYLSAFTGLRRWLAEHWLSGDGSRYLAAKAYLETIEKPNA
ncbi:MAG: hypothetical protein ABIA47_02905 [bacterium]